MNLHNYYSELLRDKDKLETVLSKRKARVKASRAIYYVILFIILLKIVVSLSTKKSLMWDWMDVAFWGAVIIYALNYIDYQVLSALKAVQDHRESKAS